MNTEKKILKHTVGIYAREGYDGLNMRKLAKDCDIAPSVMYHYFKDKDELLFRMFEFVGKRLGQERAKLPPTDNAVQMMHQRIIFQIDHAQEVVAVLKYYLHFRDSFPKTDLGYIPQTAYLHIKEVLEQGTKSGEFMQMEIDKEAKVITHAINGFLLEYYPKSPKGKERIELANSIHQFVIRSIKKETNPSCSYSFQL